MVWVKRIFKGLLVLIVLLVLLLVGLYFTYNEPLPKGKKGAEALALVSKIQTAIDQTAWDSTRYVEWSFRAAHHYIWDKKRHLVQIKWDNYRVLLNPNTINGIVYQNDQKITATKELLDKANTFFINDAFWLNAPAQIAGKEREFKAVGLPNGEQGLLITYLSGGVTPGDSYLWILDKNGLPKAWKMWVSIIPIGGLEFSWSDWKELDSGAKIAANHLGQFFDIPISNTKSYQTTKEDIFEELAALSAE